MGIKLLCILIFLYGQLSQAADIYPSTVHVQEGEGFLLWVFGSRTIENCVIVFGDINHGPNDEVKQYPFGTIESLFRNNSEECGFRIKGTTRLSEGTWFVDYYLDEVANRNSAVVKVLPKAILSCPKDDKCEQVNTKTNERKSCDGDVPEKDWECHYLVDGAMPGKVNTGIIPIVEETSGDAHDEQEVIVVPEFESVQEMGSNSIVLNCTSDKAPQSKCQVKHKSSSRLFDMQALLQSSDKKYSSFKTILNAGKCQFEIVKPIRLEDMGLWEMQMDDKKCSFFVRPEHGESVIIKTLEQRVKIPCVKDMNYPLTHCYLMPGDTNVEMQFKKDGDLRSGVCEFLVASPAEQSEWFCGYNGPLDQDIITTKFSVRRYKQPLIDGNVEVLEDGRTLVEVHHINGDAMKHCLIVNPEGVLSSLPTDDEFNEVDSKYSAYGILDKGHCGMTFHDPIEGGSWHIYVDMGDGTNLSVEIRSDGDDKEKTDTEM